MLPQLYFFLLGIVVVWHVDHIRLPSQIIEVAAFSPTGNIAVRGSPIQSVPVKQFTTICFINKDDNEENGQEDEDMKRKLEMIKDAVYNTVFPSNIQDDDIIEINIGYEAIIGVKRGTLCLAKGSKFSNMFSGKCDENLIRDKGTSTEYCHHLYCQTFVKCPTNSCSKSALSFLQIFILIQFAL